jgi:hypothetical protein
VERCGERQGYQQKSSGAVGLNPCLSRVKEALVEPLVLEWRSMSDLDQS